MTGCPNIGGLCHSESPLIGFSQRFLLGLGVKMFSSSTWGRITLDQRVPFRMRRLIFREPQNGFYKGFLSESRNFYLF